MTDLIAEVFGYLIKNGNFSSTITVIDRDIESMLYLDALRALKRPIESGEYIWIIAYDSLQNTLRDLNRASIEYQDRLGKSLFIFDAFGSMKEIQSPSMDGILSLSGYIDDNVFILKYRALINEVASSLPKKPQRVYVLSYNEAGMCRLFHNPIKVQKLTWAIREEVPFDVMMMVAYHPAECPQIEESIYLHSDFVIEGFVYGNKRKAIISKGVLP